MLYKKLLFVGCCMGIASSAKGMDKNTHYFLKLGEQKIQITPEGFKHSTFFNDILETNETEIFDANNNEAVIPLADFPSNIHPTTEDIELFVKICDGKNPEVDALKLPLLITLAAYYQLNQPLIDTLKKQLKQKLKTINNEDYLRFLSGNGLLWNTMKMTPCKILESLHWKKKLMKPALTVMSKDIQVLKNGMLAICVGFNHDHIAIYDNQLNLIKTVPGFGVQQLKNGLFAVIHPNYIQIFNDTLKLVKFIKGHDLSDIKELQNGELAVTDSYDGESFNCIFNAQLKPIATIDGYNIKQLPCGTCITEFYKKNSFVCFFDKSWNLIKVIQGNLKQQLPNNTLSIAIQSNNNQDFFHRVTNIVNNKGELIKQFPAADGIEELTDNRLAVETCRNGAHYIDIFDNQWNLTRTIPGRAIQQLKDGSFAVFNENYTNNIYDNQFNPIKFVDYPDIIELKNGQNVLHSRSDNLALVDNQWNIIKKIPGYYIRELENGLFAVDPQRMSINSESAKKQNRVLICDKTLTPIKTIPGNKSQELPHNRLAVHFKYDEYDFSYIFNDMSLNFEQHTLTTALQIFKPQGFLAKLLRKKALSYKTIFDNQTHLSIFSSLPIASIQSLVQLKGIDLLHPAVNNLMTNFENDLEYKKFLKDEPVRTKRFEEIKKLHNILEQKGQSLERFKKLPQTICLKLMTLEQQEELTSPNKELAIINC